MIAATGGDFWVFVGTYTGGKSEGIYRCRFDAQSGQLRSEGLAANIASPSFLAIHPNGVFLYAVNEVGQFSSKKTGAVSAFSLDPATGKLTLLNQQPSGGTGPCHLSMDQSGRHVLVANYGGGSVSVLPVDDTGRLGEATCTVQHRGSSVNPRRQEGPHAHGIYLAVNDRFALVPDLGLDKVMIYRLDPAAGQLKPNDPPWTALAPGSGPRHLAFSPNGAFVYVINEMACTVTAFTFEPAQATLKELQTISTQREGDRGENSTAEIEVHPSGQFLYGSNRGHDNIVVYAVDPANGRLRVVQHQPTMGKTPRHFAVAPGGRFLLVANQSSDTLQVFAIDPRKGTLSPTAAQIEVGSPVCVRFVRVSTAK